MIRRRPFYKQLDSLEPRLSVSAADSRCNESNTKFIRVIAPLAILALATAKASAAAEDCTLNDMAVFQSPIELGNGTASTIEGPKYDAGRRQLAHKVRLTPTLIVTVETGGCEHYGLSLHFEQLAPPSWQVRSLTLLRAVRIHQQVINLSEPTAKLYADMLDALTPMLHARPTIQLGDPVYAPLDAATVSLVRTPLGYIVTYDYPL